MCDKSHVYIIRQDNCPIVKYAIDFIMQYYDVPEVPYTHYQFLITNLEFFQNLPHPYNIIKERGSVSLYTAVQTRCR